MAMEGGEVGEKQSSYTYWVRETSGDAAPLPVPKKLSAEDISKQSQTNNTLGSVWNQVKILQSLLMFRSYVYFVQNSGKFRFLAKNCLCGGIHACLFLASCLKVRTGLYFEKP